LKPTQTADTASDMPDGVVSSSAAKWVLLAMWMVFLVGGLAAARFLSGSTGSALGTVGRMGSSILLIALAMLAWQQVDERTRWYAKWILLGMILGTIGDFFNANLLNFIPLPDPVLGAIVSFGIGHLFYMTGLVGLLKSFQPLRRNGLVVSILLLQLVGFAGWYGIVYLAEKQSPLLWPALGYCLLLSGTAGLATAVAVHRPALWPLALGAILFLISDLLLAVVLFRGSFPYRSEAVWLTYGPGQMLIVASTWLVDRCLRQSGTDRASS
jgi:hypothetical protein